MMEQFKDVNRRKSKHKEKLNIAMFGQKRIPSREGGVEIVVEELCSRMVAQDKALIFKKADVKDLQSKLQDACDHSEKVDAHKKQAADFICSKYNWDEIVQATLKLYRRKK